MKNILTLILSAFICCSCYAQDLGGFGGFGVSYKTGTQILAGINGAITVVNIVELMRRDSSKAVAGFGLVMGVGELGIAAFHPYNDKDEKVLDYVNAGAGLAAIVTGSMCLFRNSFSKKKHSDMDVEFIPQSFNNFAMGLKVTWTFR